MKTPTFITGNKHKAAYLSSLLGIELPHQKVDLDEIQSLDLKEIVEHKVKQAYEIIKGPVLVQDVSVEFSALNGLPGPFIRFFVDNVPFQKACDMIPKDERSATARVVYGYYDGQEVTFFEGSLKGTIALEPRGEGGFGWDKIFIPEGYSITRAEMSPEDDMKTYKAMHPFEDMVREFLK